MNRPTTLIAAALVTLLLGVGLRWFRTRGEPAAPLPARVPVLVELFSSEGCSSCGPADEWVASLDREQPVDGVTVIALELHVDYWDRLGWTDPFGAHAFAERQATYARVLTDPTVFTPEIVFDGHAQMVGGDEERAKQQIVEASLEQRARVSVAVTGRGQLAIDVAGAPAATPGDQLDVWLAVTESHLESQVEAGENKGRRLVHGPVVRELRKLGAATPGALHLTAAVDLQSAWKPGALRFVAFLQEARTRKIVGAGASNAID